MAQIWTATDRPDDVAVVAWADSSTAVLKGNPAQQVLVGPDESWGDLVLGQMLRPHSLDVLVPPPWQGQFRINGAALEQGMASRLVWYRLRATHMRRPLTRTSTC